MEVHPHVHFLDDSHVDLLKNCYLSQVPCRFRRDDADGLHEHMTSGKVLVRLPQFEEDPDMIAIKVRSISHDDTHYHFDHERAIFTDVFSSIDINMNDSEDPHESYTNDHKDLTVERRVAKDVSRSRRAILTSISQKFKNFVDESSTAFDAAVPENQPNPTRRTLPERPSMRFIRFGPFFRFAFRSLKLKWTFSGGLENLEFILGMDASFKARMRQSANAKFPKLSMSFWEDSRNWDFSFTAVGLPCTLKLQLDRKLTFNIAIEDPNKFDMEVQAKGNLDIGFSYDKNQYPRFIFRKNINFKRGGFAVAPTTQRKVMAGLILSNEFSTVLNIGYSVISFDVNAPTFVVNPSLNYEARLKDGWNASANLQIGVKYKVPKLVKFVFKTLSEYSKYKDWQWIFVKRNFTFDPPSVDVANVITNPTSPANLTNVTAIDDSNIGAPGAASGLFNVNYTVEYTVTFQNGDADQAAALGATVFIQFALANGTVTERYYPKRDSDPLAKKQYATMIFVGEPLPGVPASILVGKDEGDDLGCGDFDQDLVPGLEWEKPEEEDAWFLEKLYLSFRNSTNNATYQYIAYVNDYIGVTDSDDYFGSVQANLLPTNSTLEDQRSYQIEISTSYTSGSGTSARILIWICSATNICAKKYISGDEGQMKAGVTYRTWVDSNDVGIPNSVKIGCNVDNTNLADGSETADWLLDTVKITYRGLNYYATFTQLYNNVTTLSSRTLNTVAPSEASYYITLRTAPSPNSGTDADVSIILGGTNGTVTLPLVPGDKIVSDDVMVYKIERSKWLNWRPITNNGITSIGSLKNLTVTVTAAPTGRAQTQTSDLELIGIGVTIDHTSTNNVAKNVAHYFDLTATAAAARTFDVNAAKPALTVFSCAPKSQVDYKLRKTQAILGRIANSVRFSDRDKTWTPVACP